MNAMSELALKLIAENKAKHARGEDASYLDLGRCGLTELPDLSGMDWLETLVLSGAWEEFDTKKKQWGWLFSKNSGERNLFENTPPIPLHLPQLKKLVAIGLGIRDVRFLEKLTSQTTLDLSYNQIRDVRFLEKLTALTTLNLTGNQINDWHFLKKLTALTTLNLTGNKISDVRFLEKLTGITSLNLAFNQISDVRFLEKLTGITTLDLSRNQISDVRFLEKLTGITTINLAFNQISDVRFLEKLTNLAELYLGSNEISDWRFLEKLTRLTSLDLRDNKISDIRFLRKLTEITTLDLSRNQISDIEPLLPLIKKGIPVILEEHENGINLFNNPLTNPPMEIVEQGNAAILNYFSERSKQQFQNTEIKLILIGNSTAGKTSLSRYLRERVYEHGQPTTHGIQNYLWEPEDRELQVNCWDFGGQEYYHATHRLFLSRNSVYVLVWDACTDKGGTEPTEIWYPEEGHSSMALLEHFPHLWWLKNIRHFTSGSNPPVSVLLVQNKSARDGIKRLSPELEKPPFELLPEWIDNHIDIAASAQHQHDPQPDTRKWQRSFEEFEERLFDKLKSQLTHYEFAVYHRDIRDRVRALASGDNPVNEMSWTAFEEMCRDIEPDAKMDLVQIYLRDITGDILYFDKNERLRHRVFLRPDWVCNRIYAILSRKVLERQGLFDRNWVQEALQCEESEALDFVELMREFQLVFAENDENGAPTGNYVAPQYLPDTCTNSGELDGAKKYANLAHAFTLWFPEFLPKSHIARFVAHWGGNAKQRLFWKNGLLFQTAGCTALVERSEEFKIRVDIQQGDTAKRAAAIQRIFQSFLDLEDGQAGFAVSLNAQDFVWWPDAEEAIRTRARQVKIFPSETAKHTDIQPFIIFQKPVTMAKKVFISYSHRDEDAMKELDKFLGPLERKGDIEIWTDRKILPGQNWKDEILHALNSADLTLLLVSANFLDSNFINDEEIPRAFQRREAEGKHVVPIILNYCLWDITDLKNLQAIPKDGRPIADYPNAAQGWSEVARALIDLLK
jgi:Leucine-rich repeat (LRR) protein